MTKPVDTSKQLNAESEAISKALQGALTTIDTSVEGEQTRSTDQNVFKDTLPEGLTMDHIQAADQHKVNFAAGSAHAVAHLGMTAAVEQRNHGLITRARIKMSPGEHLDITYTPVKEGQLPSRTEGGQPTPYKSFGSVQMSHRSVTDTKGGQIGAALAAIKAASEAILGK